MKSPLHVLHLEDNPNDAILVQAALEGAGIECVLTRVQTRDDFVAALQRGGIDLILSDYALPAFDGLAAAAIVLARFPAIPLILVSGTLGEERAIDALKSGATDYVLKDRLVRLAPAVRRAMQQVEERAELRQVEAQFIEAQKMEAVGQLAGGVAHDFNNMLGVIMGYSELIAMDISPDSPLRVYTEEIRLASERAVGLTRQLLVFSRKQTVQPVVLDLSVAVADVEKMLRRLVDENIVLTVAPTEHPWHVRADAGYVGQVLMNLVVNARDAMPYGGALTVATSNITLDAEQAEARPGAHAGDYVMLSVSDTGTGMTDAVKGRLFEAFFTTKPKGKGTGLGLATCRTIVQQSGGYIGVLSELGRGTTFNICFPRVVEPLDVVATAAQSRPLPHGTETVLVVEDEPLVRHLARSVLEAHGYCVLLASNGQDALHVVRAYAGPPIALVITDIIMPVMGGKVMAEWLTTSHPAFKFLFTSGYDDSAITHEGVLGAGIEFLAKPYTPAALVCKVRELLDSSASRTNGFAGFAEVAPHAPF